MLKNLKVVQIVVLMSCLSMSQSQALDNLDNRTAIYLTAAERNLVLGEMREFLIVVQQITQGISNKNIEKIVSNAKKMGLSASNKIPPVVAAKLPAGFKKLASDTHLKFDEISRNAEDLEDENLSLTQLSTLLNNCTACHAMYRLEAVK